MDPDCPQSGPNGFDSCSALKKFQAWNNAKPMDEAIHLDAEQLPKEDMALSDGSLFQKFIGNIFLICFCLVLPLRLLQLFFFFSCLHFSFLGGRRKRQAPAKLGNDSAKSDDDYYAYDDDAEYAAQLNGSKSTLTDYFF